MVHSVANQREGGTCQIFSDTCMLLRSIGTRKYAEHFEFPKEIFGKGLNAQLIYLLRMSKNPET